MALKSLSSDHSQHGFQQGHSTYMALINMQDRITKAIDNNEYSVGVFFDLAKAFDAVNHKILLEKLEHYGVRGIQLKWFSSYLYGRAQKVFCNGTWSDLNWVNCSVPQGSNLGPLLFILYINDLANISPTLYFILFADDTNVFYSCGELVRIINEELLKINDWFLANKLSLNFDKTNYILFKSHRKPAPKDNPGIKIQDLLLNQVESTRFLGIHVDQHLTWKRHISEISLKIAKNIGVIHRIAHLLPQSIKLSLYYALVYPYLSYCNLIWAINYPSRLKKLVYLQKRIVRLIAGVRKWEHSSPYFIKFKVLNIDQIRDFQIGEFFFRLEHHLLSPVFNNFLPNVYEIHSHYTRNATKFRSVKAHSNIRIHTIKSQGSLTWNSFPLEILIANNLFLFKKDCVLTFYLHLLLSDYTWYLLHCNY